MVAAVAGQIYLCQQVLAQVVEEPVMVVRGLQPLEQLILAVVVVGGWDGGAGGSGIVIIRW
jgi:hypothetical protein